MVQAIVDLESGWSRPTAPGFDVAGHGCGKREASTKWTGLGMEMFCWKPREERRGEMVDRPTGLHTVEGQGLGPCSA